MAAKKTNSKYGKLVKKVKSRITLQRSAEAYYPNPDYVQKYEKWIQFNNNYKTVNTEQIFSTYSNSPKQDKQTDEMLAEEIINNESLLETFLREESHTNTEYEELKLSISEIKERNAKVKKEKKTRIEAEKIKTENSDVILSVQEANDEFKTFINSLDSSEEKYDEKPVLPDIKANQIISPAAENKKLEEKIVAQTPEIIFPPPLPLPPTPPSPTAYPPSVSKPLASIPTSVSNPQETMMPLVVKYPAPLPIPVTNEIEINPLAKEQKETEKKEFSDIESLIESHINSLKKLKCNESVSINLADLNMLDFIDGYFDKMIALLDKEEVEQIPNLISELKTKVQTRAQSMFEGQIRKTTKNQFSEWQVTLRELCQNAIDSYQLNDSSRKVTISYEDTATHSIVSVKDNGCGMSLEVILKYLLIPYNSTKKDDPHKIGEHGIGWFSVIDISDIVKVTSKKYESKKAHAVVYKKRKNIEQIEAFVCKEDDPDSEKGTEVVMYIPKFKQQEKIDAQLIKKHLYKFIGYVDPKHAEVIINDEIINNLNEKYTSSQQQNVKIKSDENPLIFSLSKRRLKNQTSAESGFEDRDKNLGNIVYTQKGLFVKYGSNPFDPETNHYAIFEAAVSQGLDFWVELPGNVGLVKSRNEIMSDHSNDVLKATYSSFWELFKKAMYPDEEILYHSSKSLSGAVARLSSTKYKSFGAKVKQQYCLKKRAAANIMPMLRYSADVAVFPFKLASYTLKGSCYALKYGVLWPISALGGGVSAGLKKLGSSAQNHKKDIGVGLASAAIIIALSYSAYYGTTAYLDSRKLNEQANQPETSQVFERKNKIEDIIRKEQVENNKNNEKIAAEDKIEEVIKNNKVAFVQPPVLENKQLNESTIVKNNNPVETTPIQETNLVSVENKPQIAQEVANVVYTDSKGQEIKINTEFTSDLLASNITSSAGDNQYDENNNIRRQIGKTAVNVISSNQEKKNNQYENEFNFEKQDEAEAVQPNLQKQVKNSIQSETPVVEQITHKDVNEDQKPVEITPASSLETKVILNEKQDEELIQEYHELVASKDNTNKIEEISADVEKNNEHIAAASKTLNAEKLNSETDLNKINSENKNDIGDFVSECYSKITGNGSVASVYTHTKNNLAWYLAGLLGLVGLSYGLKNPKKLANVIKASSYLPAKAVLSLGYLVIRSGQGGNYVLNEASKLYNQRTGLGLNIEDKRMKKIALRKKMIVDKYKSEDSKNEQSEEIALIKAIQACIYHPKMKEPIFSNLINKNSDDYLQGEETKISQVDIVDYYINDKLKFGLNNKNQLYEDGDCVVGENDDIVQRIVGTLKPIKDKIEKKYDARILEDHIDTLKSYGRPLGKAVYLLSGLGILHLLVSTCYTSVKNPYENSRVYKAAKEAAQKMPSLENIILVAGKCAKAVILSPYYIPKYTLKAGSFGARKIILPGAKKLLWTAPKYSLEKMVDGGAYLGKELFYYIPASAARWTYKTTRNEAKDFAGSMSELYSDAKCKGGKAARAAGRGVKSGAKAVFYTLPIGLGAGAVWSFNNIIVPVVTSPLEIPSKLSKGYVSARSATYSSMKKVPSLLSNGYAAVSNGFAESSLVNKIKEMPSDIADRVDSIYGSIMNYFEEIKDRRARNYYRRMRQMPIWRPSLMPAKNQTAKQITSSSSNTVYHEKPAVLQSKQEPRPFTEKIRKKSFAKSLSDKLGAIKNTTSSFASSSYDHFNKYLDKKINGDYDAPIDEGSIKNKKLENTIKTVHMGQNYLLFLEAANNLDSIMSGALGLNKSTISYNYSSSHSSSEIIGEPGVSNNIQFDILNRKIYDLIENISKREESSSFYYTLFESILDHKTQQYSRAKKSSGDAGKLKEELREELRIKIIDHMLSNNIELEKSLDRTIRSRLISGQFEDYMPPDVLIRLIRLKEPGLKRKSEDFSMKYYSKPKSAVL
jgi:anti-sigma regulatory factor (Ser/Thr protein kinase)